MVPSTLEMWTNPTSFVLRSEELLKLLDDQFAALGDGRDFEFRADFLRQQLPWTMLA